MTSVTYPLDLSGHASTNLISNELHTVTEANYRDYFFIVPNFAPFYTDNFQLVYILNGEERILDEGIDFNFALPYVAGIRSTGKLIYGAVTLNNLDLAGILRTQYQTLGGEWVVDRLHVLQTLAEKVYNPRTTIWDNVTNKPDVFPAIPHYQDYDNFYSQQELITGLQSIANAIAQYRDESAIVKHLTNESNPHNVTLEQLGIPNIGNWARATQDETLLGESYTTLVTPLTLRAALDIIRATITGVDQRASLALQAIQQYSIADATPAVTYGLSGTDDELHENSTLQMNFDMIGAPYAKMLYWNINHIDTSDSDFTILTGSFMTDETGSGQFTITSNSNLLLSTPRTFTVSVRLAGLQGPVLVTSPVITLTQ